MEDRSFMGYTKTFEELKSIFTLEKDEIEIPGSDIRIFNIKFHSDAPSVGLSSKNDDLIAENHHFSYPVFAPGNRETDKVILLLHGLNERSWVKYLAWAYYLAHNTGSYVILFPISFHINRSPESWRDPRAMIALMKNRILCSGRIDMASFANVALSNRLTEDPMRFFNSGLQTTIDITNLMLSVRNGEHKIIPKSSNINIFAYSIGAFLAEIILMGNPENLFTKSKLFIFCGGSVFSNMRGTSKLIMDSKAFNRVYNYYLDDFEKSIKGKGELNELLRSTQLGMAFRSMIDLGRFKTFRENILSTLKSQIHSVTLIKDAVIPAKGVVATLTNKNRQDLVDVWDFPYLYSHENPFPIFKDSLTEKVDESFDRVFAQACSFLDFSTPVMGLKAQNDSRL